MTKSNDILVLNGLKICKKNCKKNQRYTKTSNLCQLVDISVLFVNFTLFFFLVSHYYSRKNNKTKQIRVSPESYDDISERKFRMSKKTGRNVSRGEVVAHVLRQISESNELDYLNQIWNSNIEQLTPLVKDSLGRKAEATLGFLAFLGAVIRQIFTGHLDVHIAHILFSKALQNRNETEKESEKGGVKEMPHVKKEAVEEGQCKQ